MNDIKYLNNFLEFVDKQRKQNNTVTNDQIISDFLEKEVIYPKWLNIDQLEIAKNKYQKNQLKGIKYLRDLAQPYIEDPLNWAVKFFRKLN